MRSERGRLVALLLLATVLPALEAAVLAAVSFDAAQGLPAQSTAVWPYDAYHDLRWLLVFHNSWLTFALGLLGIVVGRGLLSGALIVLCWPAEVPRPSFRRLVWRNMGVAAVAVLIVSPWAALAVMAAAVALSWFLLASIIPMLLLAPFLQRAGVVADWWRGLPSIQLVGWTWLNFALISAAGGLTWSALGWWSVPVAALAGVGNGLLWQQTVRVAAMTRRVRWARVPVAPIAVAVVMAGAVAAQAVIGITAGGPGQWRPPVVRERLPSAVRYAVIALAGHGSTWDGLPPADPNVERFSYRGLDGQQRPLPYGRVDTHRSLDSSADILAAQVQALHRRTGRPVALIAQSEGATIARTYLERHGAPPVEVLLEFSPLIRPGRAYYPPPGDRAGYGVATGWQLRGIFRLAALFGNRQDSPDEPFIRSLLNNAPFYRNRTLCPVPGVRIIAFLPTVSAAEAPPGEYAQVPVLQMPAFHGGLLGRGVVQDDIVNFLAGRSDEELRPEYGLLQRLGAAWQAPSLPVSLNPAWREVRQPDPAFSGRICQ